MLKQDDGEGKDAEVNLKTLKGLEIKSFTVLTFWKMLTSHISSNRSFLLTLYSAFEAQPKQTSDFESDKTQMGSGLQKQLPLFKDY